MGILTAFGLNLLHATVGVLSMLPFFVLIGLVEELLIKSRWSVNVRVTIYLFTWLVAVSGYVTVLGYIF